MYIHIVVELETDVFNLKKKKEMLLWNILKGCFSIGYLISMEFCIF